MTIVVKNRGSEPANELIKRFKKISVALDVQQLVKDRQYHLRPSQIRKNNISDSRRLRRRLRGLKKMKNIAPEIIVRMNDKLSRGQ
jgi:ribosomal protein S21